MVWSVGLFALTLAQDGTRLQWTYEPADLPLVEWFQYQVDSGSVTNVGIPEPISSSPLLTYQVPFSESGLADGMHNLLLQACNSSGGCSAPAVLTWTIGTTPAPVDCVVSEWTCTAWSVCASDGTQARSCTRQVLQSPSGGGLACPALSTTETQGCTPTDTIAPRITALTLSRSGKSSNYTVLASASDNVGVTRMDVSLDGSGFAPMLAQPNGTWTAALKVNASGSHTVTVRATDAAGYVTSATKPFTR